MTTVLAIVIAMCLVVCISAAPLAWVELAQDRDHGIVETLSRATFYMSVGAIVTALSFCWVAVVPSFAPLVTFILGIIVFALGGWLSVPAGRRRDTQALRFIRICSLVTFAVSCVALSVHVASTLG